MLPAGQYVGLLAAHVQEVQNTLLELSSIPSLSRQKSLYWLLVFCGAALAAADTSGTPGTVSSDKTSAWKGAPRGGCGRERVVGVGR